MTDLVQVELIHSATTIAQSFVLTTPGIIGAFFAWKATKGVADVHVQGERNYRQMDGRMDELLSLKGAASKAEGVDEERARAKEE